MRRTHIKLIYWALSKRELFIEIVEVIFRVLTMIDKANMWGIWHLICIDKGGLSNPIKLLSFDTENTNNIWCLHSVEILKNIIKYVSDDKYSLQWSEKFGFRGIQR